MGNSIKTMKQKTLHTILFLIISLMPLRSLAWGETTSYVLEHANEETLNTIATGPALALSGPGATLTFQAKKASWGINCLYVETSKDGGSSWSQLDYINSSLTSS